MTDVADDIFCLARCEDKESKTALKLMCDLYALDRIWSDIGTYRNEDYVAPNKAKVKKHCLIMLQRLTGDSSDMMCVPLQAIHRLVETLCYESRGVARELVDAFMIPDQLLKAPIGLQSGQYAEYTHYVGF